MTPLNKTEPQPPYRLVYHTFNTMNEVKAFEKEVNKLIAEGYEPYGTIAIDHLPGSHVDVVQAMKLVQK